jgi:2-polyprenyl-3-methyl-5-hydroxy-6-metoxy-1,4-benzoquinol methylase
MFQKLEKIKQRPKPFEFYTAKELWADEHTSMKMLEYHLNESINLSSRNKDFINNSVEWIVSHFNVNENSKIIDFGCGPGLYTTQLAEKNAKTSGIDFSERSIRYAKNIAANKNLDINYFHQNYLEFETNEKFDLITMIFCDFCVLSPSQRKTLLAKFRKFIKPGGSILLDVHSLNAYNNREEATIYERNLLDSFWAPEHYHGFLSTFKYDKEKITLDKYTIIEKSRTRIVYNWLQYFSQDSLTKEFNETGFEIKEFYSDVAGGVFTSTSPDIAVVVKKNKNK